MAMRTLVAVLTLSVAVRPPATPSPALPDDSLPVAEANDNRLPAGSPREGALLIRLVAQRARWFPESDSGPSLVVEAFSEEGASPRIPGPIIRAPLGTLLRVRIRNALADTLLVCGLPASDCAGGDTLRIPPGRAPEVRFHATSAGASMYWGAVIRRGQRLRFGMGGQLGGAIVIDAPRTPRDRVFVITEWGALRDSSDASKGDYYAPTLNGKSWPYTERLQHTVGDSIHWRVINLTETEHPMHLHGFYFRVDARGDQLADTVYAPRERELVVTESLRPFSTLALTWAPERAGNWLFHCHKLFHVSPWIRDNIALAKVSRVQFPAHDAEDHAQHGMAGLVLGIEVRPRPGQVARAAPTARQHIRLFVAEQPNYYGDKPAYGFAVQHGSEPPADDSLTIPGPPLVLTRGRPVEITVINRLAAPTAIHWHGIELDSYYDGVAGWSGGTRRSPLIAPGDSFVVRFTPPRAGTFIYHAHVDELQQVASGMYGAIVVLEPGVRWDPTRDHIIMLSQDGAKRSAKVQLNGSHAPSPIELAAGVTHRLRFISMIADDAADVAILGDSAAPVTWRLIAKDGAAVPKRLRGEQPARLHIDTGETYDFELTPQAGDYVIDVKSFTAGRGVIRVR